PPPAPPSHPPPPLPPSSPHPRSPPQTPPVSSACVRHSRGQHQNPAQFQFSVSAFAFTGSSFPSPSPISAFRLSVFVLLSPSFSISAFQFSAFGFTGLRPVPVRLGPRQDLSPRPCRGFPLRNGITVRK